MSKIVSIKTESEDKALSKGQKIFNAHIIKINSLKTEIIQAKEVLSYAQAEIAKELMPLNKKELLLRSETLFVFDGLLNNGKFTKNEHEIMAVHIWEAAKDLIENGREELNPLFEKYAPDNQTFDEFREEQSKNNADYLKEMYGNLGFEFDENMNFSSSQEFQAHLKEKLKEREQEELIKQQQKEKTAKQLEKETKKQVAEEKLSQSIKEVYKKLVKEFHPDREPDEAEKVRKTEVMSKITEAYAKNDLLTLLQLQLEYEQINESGVNNFSEDKLKAFNKILKEQIDNLEVEYKTILGQGDPSHPFTRFKITGISKTGVDYAIKTEINRTKTFIRNLKAELEAIKNDAKFFKAVINHIGENQ